MKGFLGFVLAGAASSMTVTTETVRFQSRALAKLIEGEKQGLSQEKLLSMAELKELHVQAGDLKIKNGKVSDAVAELFDNARFMQRSADCPYCVEQCIEKCHNAGSSFVQCMPTCQDAGK